MTDYATSLMSSFRRIPSSAIPATLECILASTTSPPPFLFSLLLDALPILLQEVTHGSEESLDDECCNFIASYVGALCHLMKKPGINVEALQNFVLRVLIPLMRLTQSYHRGIVDKVMDSFLDVVMETNAWGVLEETMIPYFIKSIYLTMGKLQNEEYTVYTSEDSTLTNVDSFPLLTSCHILASTLDASVKGKHVSESSSGSILANGCSVHMFTGNLLGDISNVTFQMLSHIPEHRSCAITVFLPHILKAFLLKNAFEISVRGQKFLFSRNDFFGKVWKCCKNLFLMGASERRDAYTVLSLYISYFSKSDGCEDDSVSGNGTFDLRAEKEFWDEMKKGLVDKESIVRKQSLHILKSTTTSNKEKKHSSVLETISNGTTSNPNSLTKRERWANKEARSLGIESLCNSIDSDSSSQLKWGAFFLLYEMLEEYGTHLVEAAWNYQMNLLLDTSRPSDNHSKPVNERLHLDPMETLEDMFDWLAVLWLRGLCHDNPQVRCLIMQSVFGIEWKNHGNYAKFVPRDFVLGSFIQGLNDPVHHKEFGLKGVYSSRTIDGASTFLQQYTMCLSEREQMKFLSDLATLVKNQSFGRAGLMSLAECVAAAAFGIGTHHKNEVDIDSTYYNDRAALLDVFRFIIESSKQHFNPNYRLKVCGKILDATISVMSSSDVALEPLLHFISSFPPDFVNYGGSLREKVRKWLRGYEKQDFKLVNKLNEFPGSFINHNHSENDIVTYDDEDMELWELKAKRWARALFLAIEEEHQLDSLLQFIQTHGNDLCNKSGYQKWLPVKYMILILSVVQELHEMKNKTVDNRAKRTNGLIEIVDHAGSMVIQKFTESFTFILKDLESYTKESCTVFWSKEVGDTTLPSSIKGRLGGLSQRRLSSSNTTAVLQAITSVKTLASISSYCAHFQEEESLSSTLDVLSDISWDIISHTSCNSETKAEIQLGAYEALHHILKSLVLMPSSSALSLLTKLYDFLSPEAVVKPHIGFFVQMYLDNINYLIETGYLARARRAILIEWKWLCLESLLSIPKNALQRGVPIKNCDYFFSDGVVRKIFNDLVDSLENASEGSVLPMLRSLRLVLDLFVLGCRGSTDSSCDSIDVQMMWHLVRSSWLLHVSCNKRRVAPIAALLSSVLHNSVFSNMDMHEFDNTPGPLKWEVTHGSEESLDDECCNFIASYVGALCHLMKKPGINVEALQNFVLRVLIPLMRLTQSYHRGIVDKVMDSFLDVVMETNAWGVLEETMIPYFIKSIYLTMGKLQNEEYTVYTSEDSTLTNVDSFPLLTSCHILASTLDASVKGKHVSESSSGSILANGCSVHMFTGNLLGDISNVTFQMLSHIPEHRSCAITVFLPHILKAFLLKNAFEISVRGQKFLFSRNDFFGKVWKCCKNLFLMGASERRDAYTVLSLYISYFSKSDGCEDDSVSGNGTFDLRAEKEFWDEMKKGLVDKESIVRKQSLHILKSTTTSNKEKKHSSVLETISNGTTSNPNSLTKRERWANKEARSLGIESLCNSIDSDSSSQLKWGAFFLLYEMLEEYGTHLVEAAWNYQMNLLLDTSRPSDNHSKPVNERLHLDPMETLEDMFDWLAVLWLRGLCHDNPQVRCLIMQSVFGIEWKNHGNYAKFVPRDFVLGSFIQGLNDPVHHKEFGLKGVYSSRTIDGASTFLQQYTMCLSEREQMKFLSDLATLVKNQSFGRAGLMSLAECVAAAAFGIGTHHKNEVDIDSTYYNDRAALLDVFRFIIESSKQHFNPNYRLKVCGKILDATISVMSSSDVALEPLLHFISSFPPDFVNYGGSLREKVRKWLRGYEKQDFKLVNKLNEFPGSFINHNHSENDIVTYDDEDMELWELKAKRWARALFLAIEEEHQLDSLLQFIQTHGNDLCNKSGYQKWLPVKYMILILSVVQELHEMKNKTVDNRAKRTNGLIEIVDHAGSMVIQKFTESFTFILKDLESYTKESCTVFWSKEVGDTTLPSSIKGRLGGLSQRRLSSSNTTAVLQAITSVKTLASISSYCAHFQEEESLSSTLDVLSDISWDIISHTSCNSETKAEIQLGAYEALHHILKSLVLMPSSSALSLLTKLYDFLSPEAVVKPHIGFFVQMYLDNINYLIETGYLARARRAILIEWKWLCLESLLSIPKNALQRGVPIKNCDYFFSDGVVRKIFNDLVDSLENASEGSVLPMLRSLRLVLDLFVLGCRGSTDSSCDSIDVQMMWHLVRSSWLLHVSCNKRRVAPIAALLSSVLHNSVFSNMDMHEFDNTPGPLKWFVEKILEEGTRSPRTIRLAALHLTGLWLSHPAVIKYYMKELKLLTLYGSVAFDEDFEAEVTENHDARTEVSILSTSPDPELTEVFINTELYARVSVAVMFNKLDESSHASLQSGKLFLLELIHSVVNDTDLAKELYKKYSATHRRKVRAWQMICILSQFVDQEILSEVMDCLHTALYRNNMPAVRQYLETFAISVYLKFPSLVGEELVPMVRKYDMRTQALSSYVFIAANVILHANKDTQSRHLNELLPPIVPLLTSHHHSLRGFTQLLVYQVLSKLLPVLDFGGYETMSLEKRCFVELKSFLEDNSDCARLRVSMEVHLDAFDPKKSITPAGIFSNRVDDIEFECAHVSLLERVIDFLNDVRKDLRSSMAKDATQLKNEQINVQDSESNNETTSKLQNDISLDFQKKVIVSKHEMQDSHSGSLNTNDNYNSLLDVEKEDELLDQTLRARNVAMEKLKAGRQQIILVASLLDRVPNLAGLARTCEVFKAASLVIDNANILHDKQFQLISVTAEKWVPIIEVPVSNVKGFLEKKKQEGFSILGLEQTANSFALDQYTFPKKTVLVLGREKEGIPVDLIHILDACIEIPQLGVVRSLNVHVSGAIALWEYTRQQRSS